MWVYERVGADNRQTKFLFSFSKYSYIRRYAYCTMYGNNNIIKLIKLE